MTSFHQAVPQTRHWSSIPTRGDHRRAHAEPPPVSSLREPCARRAPPRGSLVRLSDDEKCTRNFRKPRERGLRNRSSSTTAIIPLERSHRIRLCLSKPLGMNRAPPFASSCFGPVSHDFSPVDKRVPRLHSIPRARRRRVGQRSPPKSPTNINPGQGYPTGPRRPRAPMWVGLNHTAKNEQGRSRGRGFVMETGQRNRVRSTPQEQRLDSQL